MAPANLRLSKSRGRSRSFPGEAAARRPAYLHGLEGVVAQCAAVGSDAAGYIKNNFAQRGAEGHFDEPRICNMARDGKGFCAWRVLRAYAA